MLQFLLNTFWLGCFVASAWLYFETYPESMLFYDPPAAQYRWLYSAVFACNAMLAIHELAANNIYYCMVHFCLAGFIWFTREHEIVSRNSALSKVISNMETCQAFLAQQQQQQQPAEESQ